MFINKSNVLKIDAGKLKKGVSKVDHQPPPLSAMLI